MIQFVNHNLGWWGGGFTSSFWFFLDNSETVKSCSSAIHFAAFKNCRNSRTSNDINMKLGPVTNLYKGNTATSKIDNDFMSANRDAIVIFPIYGQFRAIQKPISGYLVCNTTIFIYSNLLSYKNWKQN